MEENPPTQDPGPSDGREAPRPRTQRAAFSAPEPAAPKARPADRNKPRPDAAKAAPAVTFQPPPGEAGAEAAPPQPGRGRTPRKQKSPTSSGTPKPTPPKAATPGQRRAAGPAVPGRTARSNPEPATPESAAAPQPDTPERAAAPQPHSPERTAAPQPTTPERTTAPQQTSEPVSPAALPRSGAHRVTPDRPSDSARDDSPPREVPPATPAESAPAKATPADGAPATATRAEGAPAKATPAKAVAKKANPRRSGLASRTEITPAKAFPGQASHAPEAGPAPKPAKKAARKSTRPSAVPADQTSIPLTPAPDLSTPPPADVAPTPVDLAPASGALTSGAPTLQPARPDESTGAHRSGTRDQTGTDRGEPSPAGTADVGASHAGAADAGTPDARASHADTADAATPDARASDAETVDAATPDVGASHAGIADAGTPDARASHGGIADAGTPDVDASPGADVEADTPRADAGASRPALGAGIIPTQPSPAEAAEATTTQLRSPVAEVTAPEAGEANGTREKALRADAPLPEPATAPTHRAGDAEQTPGSHRAGGDETRVEVPAELISAVEATRTAARVAVPTAWSRIVADPGHTPELLALAAVQLIGPRAADWARDARESYPSADPAAIARLAVQQFSRRAGIANAFASVAGTYAPVALLGTTGWTHAELVLHVAAAFGQDPTDLARAADLLVLTRVHPTHEDAHAAIAATMEPAPQGETGPGDAVWRLGRMAANQTAGWLALRAVSRFFPGTALLVTALLSRSGAENLGVRAVAYYRAAVQRP